MDDTEFQELSRKAAECLPTDFWPSVQPDDVYWPWRADEVTPVFEGFWPCENERTDWTVWLHESTEACAEIMVRVLWPAGIYIQGIDETGACFQGIPCRPYGSSLVYNENRMLAFRIAVLRALIALSSTQAEAK